MLSLKYYQFSQVITVFRVKKGENGVRKTALAPIRPNFLLISFCFLIDKLSNKYWLKTKFYSHALGEKYCRICRKINVFEAKTAKQCSQKMLWQPNVQTFLIYIF